MEETIEGKIKNGRSETVEFLPTIDKADDLGKFLISFANNKGGSLFIGVNQKGKIVGAFPEFELKSIEKVYEFIDGDIVFENIIHEVKHFLIIEMRVSKSTLPIKLVINREATYYYRVGGETIKANKVIISLLNFRKFQKSIEFNSMHFEIMNALDTSITLSTLYKRVNVKPKIIDRLLSELIYLGKVNISIEDKTLYYSTFIK